MKRFIFCVFFTLISFSCREKVDRNHLDFNVSHTEIEKKISIIDSVLANFPIQKDENSYQNFYIKNNYYYINNNKIFNLDDIRLDTLAKVLNSNISVAKDFFDVSVFLSNNNIQGGINSCLGWEFFYKFSNDRGQYRTIIISKPNLKEDLDICHLKVIDRKGNLLLIIGTYDQ